MTFDTGTRLREARRELHYLKLRIEQYRLHLAESGGHPLEAARARAVLQQLLAELDRQREYRDLLEQELGRLLHENDGIRVAQGTQERGFQYLAAHATQAQIDTVSFALAAMLALNDALAPARTFAPHMFVQQQRGGSAVRWEYQKILLNDHPRKGDEVDLLSAAGEEGWELVAIAANNIAYLKRAIGDDHEAASEGGEPTEVKPKYRDPATGETWSGRGRMATWLKHKQDAGEDIETYRVR